MQNTKKCTSVVKTYPSIDPHSTSPEYICILVGDLRELIGVHCADLSTSVKFDTEVDQSILISFFEGAKAGAHWGRHNN